MRVQEKTKIKFGVDFKCISEEKCVKLKLEGVDQVVQEGYVDLSYVKLYIELVFLRSKCS